MENFSCDLIEESKKHLSFLTCLQKIGVTLNRISSRSLHRYVDLWLPLVQAVMSSTDREADLIPPPDIAWLWHCHRLAPTQYESYVRGRFGFVLEAVPSFAFQTEKDENASGDAIWTRKAWNAAYPGEAFYVQQERQLSSEERLSAETCREKLNGYNLLASTQRQSTFLWHVSMPQFQDEAFLVQGIDRYHKFLMLVRFMGNDDDLPLVPTYEIDLLWHTHILTSIRGYNQDCIRICGRKFYHDDDSIGKDRTPGVLLDQAFQHTESLWQKHHGAPYKTEGCMNYRGNYNHATWNPSKIDTQHSLEPQSWLDLKKQSHTSTGEPLFIKAEKRNKNSKIEPNPLLENYAFGYDSFVLGYYSLETKEGWKILLKRLSRQEIEADRKLNALKRKMLLGQLGWSRPTSNELNKQQDELEEMLSDLRQQQEDVKRRLKSNGPGYWTDDVGLLYTTAAIVWSAGCGGSGGGGGVADAVVDELVEAVVEAVIEAVVAELLD